MAQSIASACSTVRRLPDLCSDERGVTMIEATYVIPFLLLFLLMTSQVVLILYDAVSIEYVLERSARDIASIGVSAGVTGRMGAIKDNIRSRARELGVTLNDTDIWVCVAEPATDPTQDVPCAQSAGRPNDQILIVIKKKKPLLFLALQPYTISSQVMVRNEPYLNS